MFKKLTYTSDVLALLCGICGLILLIFPTATFKAICVIVGVAFFVSGVIRILNYSSYSGDVPADHKLDIIKALSICAAALIMTFSPGLILGIINVAVGLGILAVSIFGIQSALDRKAIAQRGWELSLVIFAVAAIFAIIMIFGGISATNVVIRLAGVALLINAFTRLKPYILLH